MATFEEHLTQLEAVVERLERGELSLDESVRLFEQGVHLSNACRKELDAAEGRIQLLVDRGAGELRPTPIEVQEAETESGEEGVPDGDYDENDDEAFR